MVHASGSLDRAPEVFAVRVGGGQGQRLASHGVATTTAYRVHQPRR